MDTASVHFGFYQDENTDGDSRNVQRHVGLHCQNLEVRHIFCYLAIPVWTTTLEASRSNSTKGGGGPKIISEFRALAE